MLLTALHLASDCRTWGGDKRRDYWWCSKSAKNPGLLVLPLEQKSCLHDDVTPKHKPSTAWSSCPQFLLSLLIHIIQVTIKHLPPLYINFRIPFFWGLLYAFKWVSAHPGHWHMGCIYIQKGCGCIQRGKWSVHIKKERCGYKSHETPKSLLFWWHITMSKIVNSQHVSKSTANLA